MSKIIDITNKNIKELNTGISFLTFSAPWCGPCRQMAPLIEKLSEELTEVKFGKVDVDESGDLAMEYGIRTVPTMLVLKDGEIIITRIGGTTIDKIKEVIEEVSK